MREKEVRGLMEAYSQVHAPQELTEEQVWEEVETWVNSLLEEGYDLSDYTWEEMYEAYIEEQSGSLNKFARGLGGALRDLPQATMGQLQGIPNDALRRQEQRGKQLRSAVSSLVQGSTPKSKPQTPVIDKNKAAEDIFKLTPGSLTKPAVPIPKPLDPVLPAASSTPRSTPTSASSRPPVASRPRPAATPAAKPAGSAMDQFAKANPKLAASAAERDRTRGTSATTNPLMKDMKSKLPEPKPAPTLAGTVAAASKPTAFNPSANAAASSAAKPTTPSVNKATGSKKPGSIVSGVDLFDIVKGHLLDEGYADSEEGAMVIMVNMSEEWKESILESCGVELELDESQHARENPEKYERSSEAREGRRKRSGINDPNTGINSPAFQAFMAKQMGGKKKKD